MDRAISGIVLKDNILPFEMKFIILKTIYYTLFTVIDELIDPFNLSHSFILS
jgi:hypothetical protein